MNSGFYYNNRELEVISVSKEVIGGIPVLLVTWTPGCRPYGRWRARRTRQNTLSMNKGSA